MYLSLILNLFSSINMYNYIPTTTTINASFLKCILFFTCAFIGLQTNAQDNNELTGILDKISQLIEPEVKLSKSIFQQELVYEEESPNRITLRVNETGTKKNRTTSYEYALNLGFVKANMIRVSATKSQMAVIAKSSYSGIVKVTENGEADGFENELKIRCSDIDMARAIESLLKEAVPIAEKLWKGKVLLPEDKAGKLAFLKERIVDFSTEDEGVRQSMNIQEDGRLSFLTQEYDEKEDEALVSYIFDLEDINPSMIKASTKNDAFTISIKTTSQNNYIEEMEGDEKSFINSITLYSDNYEQAQTIIMVFKSLVEKARKEARSQAKSGETTADNDVHQLILDFDFNEEKITQVLTNGCTPTFTKTVAEDEEITEMKYVFDMSDMYINNIELDADRKGAEVKLSTKNNKRWITVYEDDEQENYRSGLSIGVPDIPTGKKLIKSLATYIKSCPNETSPEDLAWIETQLETISQLEDFSQQTIETIDEESCKMRMISLKEMRNGARETIIEFNLFDVDPKQIAFNAKGKRIILNLPAQRKEKIFTEVTNSDKVEYTNEVEIELSDILVAKKMAATFMELVTTCE